MGLQTFLQRQTRLFSFSLCSVSWQNVVIVFSFPLNTFKAKYQSEGACIKVNQEQMPLAIENERGVEICTMDLKQSIY